jgi:hypothetical protein
MKCKLSNQSCKAITRKEVIVVIAVLVVGATMLLPWGAKCHCKSNRISCVNNLKQITTFLRIWAGEHNDRFPMQVSSREGGTLEFANGPEVFRHFQIMSNEVGMATKVMFCPSDTKRKAAESFSNGFDNRTLSYFIGIDANDNFPTMLQAGDRNLSDNDQMQRGLFARSTNHSVRWTKDMHNAESSAGGNILMGDGSVQQVTTKSLQSYWENTGVPTNRLALP